MLRLLLLSACSAVLVTPDGVRASPSSASTNRTAPTVDDWTVCMTASGAARLIVRHCTTVLERQDLSSFHRSLLVSARGDAYARLGRYAAAIKDYTEAITLDPVDDDAYASRGVAEENLGQFAAAERDYGQAIARYLAQPANAANGMSDILADDYALRGRARLEMHKPVEALEDLRRAMKIDPTGFTAEARRLLRRAEVAAGHRRG